MNLAAITLIRSPISPYVRKVLTACAIKGVEVAVDPITPLLGDDDFGDLSPLRRIPVWIEGDLTLCDSSVIIQYLEETRPGPSLWPADPADRARARWLEEYGDTRVFDVLGWKLFFQIALKPRFFGSPPDAAMVERAREVELPEVLDYLESLTPENDFLFGGPTMADFSVTVAFTNARGIGITIDATRWPRFAALLERVDAQTPLGPLNSLARRMMKTPLENHRDLMAEFGMPATSRTWMGAEVRRGPLTPA